MKAYLVERIDDVSYDEYDSWVVVASSQKEAKSLCVWDGPWSSAENPPLRITEVVLSGTPRAILGSFNAG